MGGREMLDANSGPRLGAAQFLGLPLAKKAAGARLEPGLRDSRGRRARGNAAPGAIAAAIPGTAHLLGREPEPRATPAARAASTGRTMVDHEAGM